MKKEDIEAIVPLLPLQQGFLWHSLKEGGNSGVLQLCCTLEGQIDTAVLFQAWVATVKQHQTLRSSVHWQKVKSPIQVVQKTIQFDWTEKDLTGSNDIEHQVSVIRETDRNIHLDISKSPSFRITLLRTSQTELELIWTISHVLLDGWSCSIVINDLVRHYDALLSGEQPAESLKLPLNEHSRWLAQRDKSASVLYWKNYLPKSNPAKVALPTINYEPDNAKLAPTFSSYSVSLNSTQYEQLKNVLQETGLAFNSALQGVWATQLYNAEIASDVVFGATVSGREIDLKNATDRVGMFINLVPVVVRFNEIITVKEWLQDIQNQFFDSLTHAYIGLQDIQSTQKYGGKIFDTLIVFENHPTVNSSEKLRVKNFRSGIVSDFDLTLVVIPGDELTLDIRYRAELYEQSEIKALAERLHALLCSLCSLLHKDVTMLSPYYNQSRIEAPTSAKVRTLKPEDSTPTEQVVTQLESELQKIWQRTFKLESIGLEDDYFDLGGSSLQAVHIFEQIHNTLGVNLPTTTLFTSSTITALANLIEKNEPNSFWADTVEINASGSKPALFIPVISTDMLMYKNLSAQLGKDQPIYAFRASDTSLGVEDIADRIVQHIRSIQVEGPYHLAGLSGAGMLAWVIAQKLQDQKQIVALLALFDTYGPEYPKLEPPFARLCSISHFFVTGFTAAAKRKLFKQTKTKTPDNIQISGIQVESEMHLLEEYQNRLAQEYQASFGFVLETNKGKPFFEQWINLICLGLARFRYGAFTMRGAFIVFIQGLWLEYQTSSRYRQQDETHSESIKTIQKRHDKMYDVIRPYQGHIAYFRVNTRPPGVVDDPLVGWEKWIGKDVSVYEIPGTHNDLLRLPNVAILAKYIKQDLSELETNRANLQNRARNVR